MKYVIKEVKSNAHYAYIEPKSSFLEIAFTLSKATQFSTMEDAVEALIVQARKQVITMPRFTIVGVEEVTEPQYKEVLL